jgi:hypothetical protein
MRAIDVRPSGKTLEFSEPRTLFETRYVGGAITVAVNWTAGLGK